MATPGVGTVVVYHLSEVDGDLSETIHGDFPAIVFATHDSWNSTMEDEWGGGVAQPSASQVLLFVTLPTNGNVNVQQNPFLASEGTSAGQFSLLTTEVEDV